MNKAISIIAALFAFTTASCFPIYTQEEPDMDNGGQEPDTEEAVEYYRTDWAVYASHELFRTENDAEKNSLTSAIDGNYTTNFCMVRPGQSFGGVSVPGGDEVYFIVDMREEKKVNYFRLVWRHSGTKEMWCRIYRFDQIAGSNDGINFTSIASMVKTGGEDPAQETGQIVLPATEYRYYKFVTTNPACWTYPGEDCPYMEQYGNPAGKSNQINEIYLGYDPDLKYGDAQPDITAFSGKSLAAFGDSITSGKNSWAFQIRYVLGFGEFYNGAVGGAVWGKRTRPDGVTQDYSDPDFAGISNDSSKPVQTRYNNCGVVHVQKFLADRPDFVPDCIMFSYGTNDRVTETDEPDADEALAQQPGLSDAFGITGGMRWCIQTMKDRFPHAKIYVLSPIQANPEKYTTKNQDNLKKTEKIKKMCEGLGVEYIDCYNGSGITAENSTAYLRDGLHPNLAGQDLHTAGIVKALAR
ncbi:MAG: GDSL-type esterase/lipase family protein [Bacteroidales bacterium]|nr:GDSL-type esterase/lipase family protein [Bacteroides sp.]MCM1199013.1 GDSL-type esterase/lipase family protein [Clostridium sp.]MCM1503329.1 GDSL-type esterase/lipase family protein [Bacteroidales bacterium]